MQAPAYGFVDMHHHLIYGLDDGAQTWEQTRQMLTRAWENGIDRIIATPHAEPGMKPFPMEQLMQRIGQAQRWCDEQKMQLEILPGCEIFYTPQTVRMLRDGLIPTLADSDYVLVEFLPTAPYSELRGAAKALTAVGYQPIFAHIERYRCLRWPGRVQALREQYGIHMQMNADTICRKQSFFTQMWVDSMLKKGCIDVAASDAHNVTSRPCRMKACYQTLKKRFGQETADRLCMEFPGQI